MQYNLKQIFTIVPKVLNGIEVSTTFTPDMKGEIIKELIDDYVFWQIWTLQQYTVSQYRLHLIPVPDLPDKYLINPRIKIVDLTTNLIVMRLP